LNEENKEKVEAVEKVQPLLRRRPEPSCGADGSQTESAHPFGRQAFQIGK
jgi:hypothetical protein